MSSLVDKDAIVEAYEDVRNDKSETSWVILGYEGKDIQLVKTGNEYGEFLEELTDDARYYCFVRLQTGDELSKRWKFAFITWCGPDVSGMKKAKMGTDKAFVKNAWKNFAVEVLAEEKGDAAEDKVKELLIKAGGANYGTGAR